MILQLWRLLQGYVIIKIKGSDLERFLNRAARAGIGVWDTERLTTGMLVARVSVPGFRQVRALCRSQGWKVALAGKVGLPFLFAALFRRKILLVGGVAALVALYVLSGFVWFIRVDADEGLPTEKILEVAESVGLRPGIPRDEVDRHEIQKALLLNVDELAWASVTLRGTLAVIEAAERTAADLALSRPGDVIASRDGIIQRVVVFRGQALVSEGDTVRAGDVLISGVIPPKAPEHRIRLEAGEPPYVHADGIIQARVWYEGAATARLIQESIRATGEQAWAVEFRLGSKFWRVGSGPAPFADYSESRGVWQHELGGRLPLEVTRILYEEVTRSRVAIPEEQARSEAIKAAWAQLEAHLPAGATVIGDPYYAVEVSERGGLPVVSATARVEVVEDVEAFREIEF